MFFKYLRYMAVHKWWVLYYCVKEGIPFRGIVHDWHKFLPSEFIPYMRLFYGTYPSYQEVFGDHRNNVVRWKEAVEEDADYAWLLHQKRGKHHWQFWVLMNDDGSTVALPMPSKYVKEMVCDWRGAGRAITGEDNVVEWYAANWHNMNLHPATRHEVESMLRVSVELPKSKNA